MSHKRKYNRGDKATVNLTSSSTTTSPDLSLYIQAHEATLIRGPQSLSIALSLEAPDALTLLVNSDEPQIGSALIQWGGNTRTLQPLNSDSSFPEASDVKATWVDRWVSQ
jgi:hypothetical protein